MTRGRWWWRTVGATALTLAAPTLGAVPLNASATAGATATQPVRMVYLPAGYLTNVSHHDTKLDQDLAQLDTYGINEGLIELDAFDPGGVATVTSNQATMLARWQALVTAYDQAHGTALDLGVVMNGTIGSEGLDLDDPATRAAMVASVDQVVSLGVRDVQLDLEPYPTTAGFPTLLDELDTSFATNGWTVNLSTVAPADTATWGPAYLRQISSLVTQVDPLFYDSGKHTTVAAYQAWVREGLDDESANMATGTRLVPVLPSYGRDPWHLPTTENITTSTGALAAALGAGDDIEGAGVWWWPKFGLARSAPYAADRAEWQAVTRSLPYSG